MAEKAVIAVGKKAKDFSLRDQKADLFRLSDLRGKKVLLSFHPLAWTPICATQMQDLERHAGTFEACNTVVVGLSIDSIPCKTAWGETLGIRNVQLLADFWPHGAVAKSFGILRAEGFSERANIVVDEGGKVLFVKVYPIKQLPDIKEILEVVR